MTQSILVLEENPDIQDLIAISLKDGGLSLAQESNPELFARRARSLRPDLIFLSNSDCARNYRTFREIRQAQELQKTPVVLLANARDELDEEALSTFEISGLLRKPFEASGLQEQLQKFVSLDENFGLSPEVGEDVSMDMSVFDDELTGLIQEKPELSFTEKKSLQNNTQQQKRLTKGTEMKENRSQNSGSGGPQSGDMDSLLLDETLDETMSFESIPESEDLEINNNPEAQERQTLSGGTDAETPAPGGLEGLRDSGLEDRFAQNRLMDQEEEDFAFELSEAVAEGLDEFEATPPPLFEEDLDLEEETEPLMSQKSESAWDEEVEQPLREGLTDIDLELNDFENPEEMWTRPPDLKQTLREGLGDISLEQNDFRPELPKNLTALGSQPYEVSTVPEQDSASGNAHNSKVLHEMDDYRLEAAADEMAREMPHPLDHLLLTDSGGAVLRESTALEDTNQFLIETSDEELEEELYELRKEKEIGLEMESVPPEDFLLEEENAEDALEELEDLKQQMDTLEAEEEAFEEEAAEFEKELELEEIEDGLEELEEIEDGLEENELEKIELEAEISAEEAAETWTESKDELRDFVADELGDLLEEDESDPYEELEKLEAVSEGAEMEDLREMMIEELGDLLEDDDESGPYDEETEESPKEEVFDSWDDAEDAMMAFKRKPASTTSDSIQAETGEKVFESWDDAEDAFMEFDRAVESPETTDVSGNLITSKLSEEELTAIVTHSVQKALESSISSLVKQVVSELKERESQKS